MLYKKQFKCVAFQNSHYLLKHIFPNFPSSYQSLLCHLFHFWEYRISASRSGISGSYHSYIFSFLKTAKMFSKVAAPFHIPASNIQSFQLLHVFNNICEFQFLWLQPFWWWFSRYVVPDSCNPLDCSLPGSSVHRILQARMLEWVVTHIHASISSKLPSHPGAT